MTPDLPKPNPAAPSRADALFDEYQRDIYRRTDRLFAWLMGFQWIAGIIFAVWVSPLAWSGTVSTIHLHVWAAVVLGGLVSVFPALLAVLRPGEPSTRYTIAVAQMLMSALLIHLTGGRIETHFHVFGSLAFLAFYRDWRVLVPATVVVALDHMLRGIFWPQSVYGVLVTSNWRWVEHSAWVIFEDVFLVVSCLRSSVEMRERAERTAALEQEVRTRQHAENDAHALASLTSAVGLALTKPTDLDRMLAGLCRRARRGSARRARADLDPRRERPDARAARERRHRRGDRRHVRPRARGQLPDRCDRRDATAAYHQRPARRSPARRSRIAARRRDRGVCRLSAARRLEAGRRHGDLFTARPLDGGAGIDGGGGGRGRRGHRAQTRRGRARAAYAPPRGRARHAATERATTVGARRRAARRAETRRGRDAREERFPRQHEPRAADAAERDPSLQRAPAGSRRGSGAGELHHRSPAHSVVGQAPARVDQRHPGPLEDRGRQDDRLAGDLRDPRDARRAAPHRRAARPEERATRLP